MVVLIVVQNLVGIDQSMQFHNMVLLFCAFSLKTPIRASKWELRGFDSQMISTVNDIPKRHFLPGKHVI